MPRCWNNNKPKTQCSNKLSTARYNSNKPKTQCNSTNTQTQCSNTCSKPKPASQKNIKKFRFHPSTKTHDGLSPAHANLQRLVYDYWQRKPSLVVLAALLHNRKHQDLRVLATSLQRLIVRIEQTPSKTPLLLGGGGRGLHLSKRHLRRVSKLCSVTVKVYSECIRRCKDDKGDKSKVRRTRSL